MLPCNFILSPVEALWRSPTSTVFSAQWCHLCKGGIHTHEDSRKLGHLIQDPIQLPLHRFRQMRQYENISHMSV